MAHGTWLACDGGPDPGQVGKDLRHTWGPPQCCWQSPHREMGCDNLNAGCGPASGWSQKGCGPPASPPWHSRGLGQSSDVAHPRDGWK